MHTADIRRAGRRATLGFERLETREVPAATATLAAGALTVTSTDADDRIRVYSDGTSIIVLEGTVQIGAFAPSAVTSITVNATGLNNTVIIDPNLTQPTVLTGTGTTNKLVAGGGSSVMTGSGTGRNYLFGGPAGNSFDGGGGASEFFKVYPTDVVFPGPNNLILQALPPGTTAAPVPEQTLTTADVNALLQRASAASASNDAIIVVTDRNGRILGVRVESGVSTNITGNVNNLVFAVDGAYSLALTGAYFANNQGPLTSRTIRDLSQSTITQREVQSNPDLGDPNSLASGPGLVAPVGIGGHFPANIANTPSADLFEIELTNRDSSVINGTTLSGRFNINPAFVPTGNTLFTPDSYGYQSGLLPTAQSRGIATLPGGIPIYKNGQVVGGIGVFFPGRTGYASEENSSLSATYDASKPDRSLEAEWMAFAAVGGTAVSVGGAPINPIGTIGGVALPAGFGLPNGEITLVGIQLDTFGPGGSVLGPRALLAEGQKVGIGNPDDGMNLQVDRAGDLFQAGTTTPSGWLVTPHDGVGITAAQVDSIIQQGLAQANKTRAAIRVPASQPAKFIYAVTDLDGNVVGLYREPDATIFSIDVAVAKARNVAYYNNPAELQAIDQLPGVAAGTAFTARTFRYLALPNYPESINGAPPGYFSILNDNVGGTDPLTGLANGPQQLAAAYQSAVGYVAFNPNANFHDPNNPLNQNGVVFFPGSAALYAGPSKTLIGGFGVSGDGVNQDDVVTVAGESGYNAPANLRADQVIFRGVRLPYQEFDRNPNGF